MATQKKFGPAAATSLDQIKNQSDSLIDKQIDIPDRKQLDNRSTTDQRPDRHRIYGPGAWGSPFLRTKCVRMCFIFSSPIQPFTAGPATAHAADAPLSRSSSSACELP